MISEPSKFEPVGLCIYCSSENDLSDEHIIPYSLGGQIILPKSSCRKCAGITSGFERLVAQGMYRTFRQRMELPTRRPKKRPTHQTAKVVTPDGQEMTVEMPIDATAASYVMAHLPTPGYLHTPKIERNVWGEVTLSGVDSGPRNKTAWKDHPGAQFTFRQMIPINELARMYAKIAHCLVVGAFGGDAFEHWLPPYILGEKDTLPYLVGGAPEIKDPDLTEDYNLSWELCPDLGNIILIKIRLFARMGGPHAMVVAGKIKSASLLKTNDGSHILSNSIKFNPNLGFTRSDKDPLEQ